MVIHTAPLAVLLGWLLLSLFSGTAPRSLGLVRGWGHRSPEEHPGPGRSRVSC